MICSKIVNLDRTEAGLKSKLGKISPTIEWCYQNHDDIRRRTTSPRNLLLRQAGRRQIQAATLMAYVTVCVNWSLLT